MAALAYLFAINMIAACAANLHDFVHRVNPNSTSVGGKEGESCAVMEGRNLVCSPLSLYFLA